MAGSWFYLITLERGNDMTTITNETTITETIGSWGEITTPYEPDRRTQPRAGDIIEFPEELRNYPVTYRRCRIASIDAQTGMASIVNGMGSAFIMEDASLSISGGPFFSLPVESLEATHELHKARVWNWGGNSPGAGQGVDYHIDRPVFRATEHPKDHRITFSHAGEKHARQGGTYRHDPIPEHATLARSWSDHDGLTGYLFDIRK